MKTTKIWLCILCSFLLTAACPAAAYARGQADGDDGRTLAPYFIVKGTDPTTDSFPLKDTNVVSNINGVIAETYVTQTYTNEGANPINASYVFPASGQAAIHGMKMTIGDNVVTARIREKEEARQEYDQAESEGKSASLLEEQRPNVFTMDVANIMPGDVVQIELHYTEMLSATEGSYQFVFPTVVGPRYANPDAGDENVPDDWVASPYLPDGDTPDGTYHITANLSAGVPISDLSCKSHDITVNYTDENRSAAQVTLANPEDYAGNRDFILDYRLTGESVDCGLILQTGEQENFFMLTVQPPERYEPEDIPPREYIFVLDVSGSMEGYPLETAKQVINDLVKSLRDTDRFNLILFSDTSVQMSPVPVPATKANRKAAAALIDEQSGGGGTELAPVLQDAIDMPMEENVSRSIVVITDGYISGEQEIFDMINRNLNKTSFFSFGIGSSVNRYLIDGIAKTGRGEAFVVTDSSDAKNTARRFRSYIESPLLTDINVAYEGFDVYDIEPQNLPTLFAQRPIVLFGKWRGEPSGTIRVTGKTGNGVYEQEIPVADLLPSETNNAIPYLWARTKLERLTDYAGGEMDSEAVKNEVISLGLTYSMITPYTSFISVLETVRNPGQESTDVSQPLPLPQNVSNLAVGGGYTVGSEPGSLIFILAGAAAALINVLLQNRKKKVVKPSYLK